MKQEQSLVRTLQCCLKQISFIYTYKVYQVKNNFHFKNVIILNMNESHSDIQIVKIKSYLMVTLKSHIFLILTIMMIRFEILIFYPNIWNLMINLEYKII